MNLKEKTVVINDKTHRYSKIVMLPVSVSKRYNCTQGLIVKCIKEWTPIGESKREINKLSISKNWSQGVLKYYEPQHLYFLSTDKICEGDWFYTGKYIRKCEINSDSLGFTSFDESAFLFIQPHFLKVISSTNSELDLPKPSEQFLQVYIDCFNRKEVIEECLVEYEGIYSDFDDKEPCHFEPKVIKGEITIRKVKDSYSREEHIKAIKNAICVTISYPEKFITGICCDDTKINKWIEQNL